MMKIPVLLLALIACSVAYPAQESPYIVGGSNAQPGQCPYQISLQANTSNGWQHFCGAGIIYYNWILTAGHCCKTGYQVRAVAGVNNLSSMDGNAQIRGVTNYTIHPNYTGGVAPYDICVMKLDSPLTYNTFVQPIYPPPKGSVPSGNATLSGWGSMSNTSTADMPTNLQTATLPILNNTQCVDRYGSPPYDPTNCCTGPLSGGMSACSGDSGGPLAQTVNGYNQLIGIVSWGIIPCGQPNSPSVYTCCSYFVDWVNENIY